MAQTLKNPYTLSFGKSPKQIISRNSSMNDIIETFNDDNPSQQIYSLKCLIINDPEESSFCNPPPYIFLDHKINNSYMYLFAQNEQEVQRFPIYTPPDTHAQLSTLSTSSASLVHSL